MTGTKSAPAAISAITAPPTMYQVCSPIASATGPATARLRGIMAEERLPTRVNTRPCISGTTMVCSRARSGPLTNGFITPATKIAPIANPSPPSGARPMIATPIPSKNRPMSDVYILLRNPPHQLNSRPPSTMPVPQEASSHPSWSASPPKCSVTSSGIRVKAGLITKLMIIAMAITATRPGHPQT